MTCVSRSKIFGPTKRSLKMAKKGFVAQDGPNVLSMLDLCDLNIPFQLYDQATLNLPKDTKDFPLQITGFGDNFTFLVIRPRYDLNNRLDSNHYIVWKKSPEGEENVMSDVMVLTGNSTQRWPIIYLTNDTGWPAEVDVLAGKFDDDLEFFKKEEDTLAQPPNFLLDMLTFDDLKSNADDLNLYIHPAGETQPQAYTTVESIINLNLDGNQLIIDDNAMGEIVLRFIDKFNAQQAYCGVVKWMNDPFNYVLPQPVDTAPPVISWNPLRSGPLTTDAMDQRQAAIFFDNLPFDSDNVADKEALLNYFITEIIDDRDGDLPFDPYLVTITRNGSEVEGIASLGSYVMSMDVSDCAGNTVCATVQISVRPGSEWIDPDNYTLNFDYEFDNNLATFTPTLSNPYVTGSFSWDVGDGTTYTDMIVQHRYAVQSVFVVTLIFDPDDDELTQRTVTKNVVVPAPTYGFTWDPTLIITPSQKSVLYDVNVTGTLPAGSYDWDFDNSNTLLGTNLTQVEEVYAVDGTYNPFTLYTPTGGELPVDFTQPVDVGLPAYSIWFNTIVTYDALNRYLLEVEVQNDSAAVSGTYSWNFGPSFPTPGGLIANVEYPSSFSGSQVIEFTHESDVDPLIWTQEQTIDLLQIDWDFVMNGRDITVTGTNTSTGSDYVWEWGDMFSTSATTLAPVTHAYATSGFQTLSMKLFKDSIPNPGEQVEYRRVKNVHPFQINFSSNQIGVSNDVQLDRFTDLDGSLESGVYTWTSAAFATQTGQNIVATFPGPGTYSVTLTFNSFDGRYNDVITQDVTVI